MNRPIIIGGNHHNTLGVIRALGYKGITSLVVLVTEEEKPYVSYSKYIDSCVLLRNSQDVVPFLLEYQKDIQGKQVVLSCADFATAELDKHYDELEKYYYLPTSHKQGRCNHYMNKEEMSRLAVSKGMKAPKSWTIEPKTQINISEVKFPCIAKPLVSIFGSKLEIQILRNKEELLSYLDEYKDHRFFLQEFIEKDFEYQLIGCSLRNGEEVIIPGYSKCIRPCQGTNTGFLEYKAFGGFLCNLQACANFIKEIGYQGLFSMEFIRDKKGVDYFLEINMRNDGNAICVTGAGVNLPFIWYNYCVGEDYHKEATNPVTDIYVMPEFDDFTLLLKRKVKLSVWIKDLCRTSTFMENSRYDPKPFIKRRKDYIVHLFRKALGKFQITGK